MCRKSAILALKSVTFFVHLLVSLAFFYLLHTCNHILHCTLLEDLDCTNPLVDSNGISHLQMIFSAGDTAGC